MSPKCFSTQKAPRSATGEQKPSLYLLDERLTHGHPERGHLKISSKPSNDSWMWVRQASKAQKDELLWYEIQSLMAKKTKAKLFVRTSNGKRSLLKSIAKTWKWKSKQQMCVENKRSLREQWANQWRKLWLMAWRQCGKCVMPGKHPVHCFYYDSQWAANNLSASQRPITIFGHLKTLNQNPAVSTILKVL